MTLRRALTTTLLTVVPLLAPAAVNAKLPDPDYWRWFEVEVLLFKHTAPQESLEQFPLTVTPIDTRDARDLITVRINRDFSALQSGLTDCPSWPELGEYQDFNWRFDCQTDNENQWIPIPGNPLAPESILTNLQQTEVVIDGFGGDIQTAKGPFLMPDSVHVLTETRTELQRKGLAQPLLHVAWRQPVFKEKQNYALRVFGGKQFTEQFRYDGFKREPSQLTDDSPAEPGLVARVEQLLEKVARNDARFTGNNQKRPQQLSDVDRFEQVWELDGLLHIFLIGNYLHIDNEFNLRNTEQVDLTPDDLQQQAQYMLSAKSTQQPFLRAYHFNQLRRVISHETHYFDHPKVGMVIQIRRTDLSAPRY